MTTLQKTEIKRPIFKDQNFQEDFEKNGYAVIDFLNPEEIAALSKAYNDLQGDMGEPAFASTIMSRDTNYRLEVSEVIKKYFSRALEENFADAQLFWGNYNVKYPGNNLGTVPLHQDPSFVDEALHSPLVIWVPLIDTTNENGALQVIPGSHTVLKQPRCGRYPFPYAGLQQTLLDQFGQKLLMHAGQAYIGSPAVFHYSPPNMSNSPRIVAAALAGPKESTLRYYHYKPTENGNFAEIFEADVNYYVTAPLFSRPDTNQYKIIETIPLEETSPDADALFDILNHIHS
jgi:hypothetical protein